LEIFFLFLKLYLCNVGFVAFGGLVCFFKDIFGDIISDLWCFWRFILWFLWIFFVLRRHTTLVTCVVFQMKKWKWLEVRNKGNLFLEWFF
jgi:hypothetical protein